VEERAARRLRLVSDEYDQVLRLDRFRQDHPAVVVGAGNGWWQAVIPAPDGEIGAGSSGVGQLPSTTGAGRTSADTTAEYPHQTPRTVKTGASSHWAWTGYCADHRDTCQQAQRAYEAFTRYDDNLARHIYLLQDINEALSCKLVTDHVEEMLRSCTPDDRQAVPLHRDRAGTRATGQGVYGCDRAARTRPWK
jgi:hypothetical protein